MLLLFVPSGLFTDQFCENGHAIQIIGSFGTAELSKCWKHINLTEQQVADSICFNFARPTNQIRNAESTLIQVAFPTTKFNTCSRVQIGSEIASGMFLASKAILPAIVTCEEDNRVFFQLQIS